MTTRSRPRPWLLLFLLTLPLASWAGSGLPPEREPEPGDTVRQLPHHLILYLWAATGLALGGVLAMLYDWTARNASKNQRPKLERAWMGVAAVLAVVAIINWVPTAAADTAPSGYVQDNISGAGDVQVVLEHVTGDEYVAAWVDGSGAHYARSTDGGSTWNEQVIDDSFTGTNSLKVDIANTGGRTVVTYVNDTIQGVAYTDDSGSSWSWGNFTWGGTTPDAALYMESSTTWRVPVMRPDSGNLQIVVKRTTNSGTSWSNYQIATPVAATAIPQGMLGFGGAADKGVLAASYEDGVGDAHVLVAHTTDGWATYTTRMLYNGTGSVASSAFIGSDGTQLVVAAGMSGQGDDLWVSDTFDVAALTTTSATVAFDAYLDEHGAHVVAADHFVIVGEDGDGNAYLHETTDGGTSWTSSDLSSTGNYGWAGEDNEGAIFTVNGYFYHVAGADCGAGGLGTAPTAPTGWKDGVSMGHVSLDMPIVAASDSILGVSHLSTSPTDTVCLLYSTDGGASWNSSAVGDTTTTPAGETSLSGQTDIAYANGRFVVSWISNSEVEIWYTDDYGGNWTEASKAFDAGTPRTVDVLMSSASNWRIAVWYTPDCGEGDVGSHIYTSSTVNSGGTWNALQNHDLVGCSTTDYETYTRPEVQWVNDTYLLGGVREATSLATRTAVYLSTNAGDTFQEVTLQTSGNVDPGRVYVQGINTDRWAVAYGLDSTESFVAVYDWSGAQVASSTMTGRGIYDRNRNALVPLDDANALAVVGPADHSPDAGIYYQPWENITELEVDEAEEKLASVATGNTGVRWTSSSSGKLWYTVAGYIYEAEPWVTPSHRDQSTAAIPNLDEVEVQRLATDPNVFLSLTTSTINEYDDELTSTGDTADFCDAGGIFAPDSESTYMSVGVANGIGTFCEANDSYANWSNLLDFVTWLLFFTTTEDGYIQRYADTLADTNLDELVATTAGSQLCYLETYTRDHSVAALCDEDFVLIMSAEDDNAEAINRAGTVDVSIDQANGRVLVADSSGWASYAPDASLVFSSTSLLPTTIDGWDGDVFLGTSTNVRAINASGSTTWTTDLGVSVDLVRASMDGQYVYASAGDRLWVIEADSGNVTGRTTYMPDGSIRDFAVDLNNNYAYVVEFQDASNAWAHRYPIFTATVSTSGDGFSSPNPPADDPLDGVTSVEDVDSGGGVGGTGTGETAEAEGFFGQQAENVATGLNVSTNAANWLMGLILVAMIAGMFATAGKGNILVGAFGGMLGVGAAVAVGYLPTYVLLLVGVTAIGFMLRQWTGDGGD